MLNQDFTATAPNQAWCGDITYIATDEGWLYPAGLKDLFSGELVGYAESERMTKHPVMQALFRAVVSRRPAAGLIHHTDRGSPILRPRISGARRPVPHAGVNESTRKLV